MTVLCAEAEEEEDGLCFSIPHLAAAAKDGLAQPVRKNILTQVARSTVLATAAVFPPQT